MTRILHTADVHLDAPFHFLGEKGAAHRQQIRQTFSRTAALAAEEHYDLLLIAGDLFNDNHPTRETQHFVLSTLAGLPLPVCILPGNHDCLDRNSVYHRLALPPNVHLLTERPTYLPFPDLDLTIAGNPIRKRFDDTPQLQNISRSEGSRWFVAVAHGNMQIPGPFEMTSRPIEPQTIAATGADYVALGDWHSFADYSQPGVRAFYSGAPEPTSVVQTKTGTVSSVTLSDNEISVAPLQVGSVSIGTMELDVTGLSEQEVIAAIQAQADSSRILNVTLTGLKAAENLLDIETIYQATADGFYWLQLRDSAVLGLGQIDPNEYPEAFVIGQFVHMLSERIGESTDERERRVAEQALQLGVALLKGHKVL